MTDNSKKLSQLPIASNTVGTDRVVILSNPAGNPTTKTITVSTLLADTSPTTSTFNPQFTTNTGNVLSISTGTQSGNYTKIGKLCFFRVNVKFANSTYADGTGQYQIVLPFPVAANTVTFRDGTLHNSNTGSYYHIAGIVDSAANTTTMGLYYFGGTVDLAWKNTTPVSWSTGNTTHFDISGIYETT
jgi:hypothetical protein